MNKQIKSKQTNKKGGGTTKVLPWRVRVCESAERSLNPKL